MKLSSCITRALAVPRTTKWLAAGLLIGLFAIPTQAFAQCAGAVGINNDGTDVGGIPGGFSDYYYGDLTKSIAWQLNPRSGDTLDVTVNQVSFGLSCFDNGKQAPCVNGNDGQEGDNSATPLQYTGNLGGTCNASLASNTAGVVTFNLAEATLDNTGCTITFTTDLVDRGIDATPDFITPSVEFAGTCTGGLDGGAEGSSAVELYNPAIDVTKTGPTLAKVGDEITYTIGFTATADAEFLGECRGNDPLLGGDIGVFVDGVTRDFKYTVKDTDPNPLKNTVTITCGLLGDTAATVSDFDDHSVDLIDPKITATKTGPSLAKVGDEITYTIGFTATSDGDQLGECRGNDPLLGGDLGVFVSGQTRDFKYTVKDTDPNPLKNEVTITCDINNRDNKASAKAQHEVKLIAPAITATKTGPTEAKVGDEITYTIGFTCTTDCDLLGQCTGNDPLLGGDLGVFVSGQTRDFKYTVKDTDPDPLKNEVTITCDIQGRDNKASAKAQHSVDLFSVGGKLTKSCTPDTIAVPNDINWEICVENTGEKAISCNVVDTTAGIDQSVSVPVGTTPSCLKANRATTSADVPSITNIANADCSVPGFDNTFKLGPAEATCEVTEVNEICRTPGFWGTHAGTEKEGRSTDLVQEVIEAAGGSLGEICGVEIDNTALENTGADHESAVEAICVHPKTLIVRQLMRQLTAAALNCVVSGGGADCTGVSIKSEFDAANTACMNGGPDLSYHIGVIDDFNNGVNSTCHDQALTDSDVFDDVSYKVPGPAGSPQKCNAAIQNEYYLVP